MGLLDNIMKLIFPQESICLFCKDPIKARDRHICPSCMGLIEFVDQQVDIGLAHLASIHYAILYNRFVVDKLHAFKFRGESYLYKPFGEILLHSINNIRLAENIDLIAYIPAHPRKESLRGYNQARLLASYLAEELAIPLLDNHIKKIRWTKEQGKLGQMEREENLRKSFASINTEDFKGKEILLIDDIITTGTTMEECSRVFIESGASRVHGLTLTSSRYIDN